MATIFRSVRGNCGATGDGDGEPVASSKDIVITTGFMGSNV
jgi:hypothetical protein